MRWDSQRLFGLKPDGKQMGCAAVLQRRTKALIVVDEEKGPICDVAGTESSAFDPDRKRPAYYDSVMDRWGDLIQVRGKGCGYLVGPILGMVR
jgi:hypothetical protein